MSDISSFVRRIVYLRALSAHFRLLRTCCIHSSYKTNAHFMLSRKTVAKISCTCLCVSRSTQLAITRPQRSWFNNKACRSTWWILNEMLYNLRRFSFILRHFFVKWTMSKVNNHVGVSLICVVYIRLLQIYEFKSQLSPDRDICTTLLFVQSWSYGSLKRDDTQAIEQYYQIYCLYKTQKAKGDAIWGRDMTCHTEASTSTKQTIRGFRGILCR